MQVKNVNLPITVTGRHVEVTEAMRDHAHRKVAGLHLDYPKIIEAKVILNVEGHRHIAEIILYCANHITIEADTTTDDMYASIDETMSKIARRMRKFKTRMLKSHRPGKKNRKSVPQEIPEAVLMPEPGETPAAADEEKIDEPLIVHEDRYKIKRLESVEAIEDMEVNQRPFIIYRDVKSEKLCVLYRREDGDYAAIYPDNAA